MLLMAWLMSVQYASSREAGVPIGTGKKPAVVTLAQPRGGWTVDRMITVSGTVSDHTINPITVSINGDRYLLRTTFGDFSRKFPAASGKNVVTVIAQNKAGTTTAQATSYAQVPVVPLKVILTSDTDGVYTDLHIYEPTDASEKEGSLDFEKMAHVFWANTASPSGGTFYLNEQQGNFDQPGYGPYLYVHRAPPKGVFLITTNYWPSGDKAHTVSTLNLTLYEGTPQEVKRKINVPLATPGTTRVLAWVKVIDGSKASVFIPGQDPEPSKDWPTNMAEVAKRAATGSGMDGEAF